MMKKLSFAAMVTVMALTAASLACAQGMSLTALTQHMVDYIALPSETYGGFALLRSILRGGTATDIAKAVAYGKRIKLYPLSQAVSPPQTAFVDAINVVFDSTIPYDTRFFPLA
jgi:hypothetical protein